MNIMLFKTAQRYRHKSSRSAFTIVELLVVVVVIAVLASISVVSYNGITSQAKEAALKSDLKNGATQLQLQLINTGAFPATANDLTKSEGTVFTYSGTNTTFCLAASSNALPGKSFHITDEGALGAGSCPVVVADGSYIQSITEENCPTSRIRAVDARDNHTYWIQKMGDGKCWMLTNLAYAGGGSNTYGDTKTLIDGTSNLESYTEPSYYIPPSGANVTTEPTNPSTSTTGSGQYGYLYNWCGAMGGQVTAACQNATTPQPDVTISICPAGWRLPTGGASGELAALNTAINESSTSSDSGLRTEWLAQRSGRWLRGVSSSGTLGVYRTSTQVLAYNTQNFSFSNTVTNAEYTLEKMYGFSVRCLAN